MSQSTVLHDQHVKLGGRMVEFAGWVLPVQYDAPGGGVIAEHMHCRTKAAIFDTSHMGQFLIRGRDAAKQLSRIGTQDAEALSVGKCRYGFLLNDQAGVIDDTILMRLDEHKFLLVVNAGTADGDLAWSKEHITGGVELVNRSAEGWGKIDLQGPAAADVLRKLTDVPLDTLAYYGLAHGRCCDRECVISRAGYTGELGYEIMSAGQGLVEIFKALLADPSVKPAGLGARDSLRLEMCYPLYGHELSTETTPLEAGLAQFAPAGRAYVGSRKLDSLRAQPGARRLAAFVIDSRRRCSPGDAILHDGKPAGTVTSGGFAPSLDVSIGLGYVESAVAAVGTKLTIKTERAELNATVCKKPLYQNGSCRVAVD